MGKANLKECWIEEKLKILPDKLSLEEKLNVLYIFYLGELELWEYETIFKTYSKKLIDKRKMELMEKINTIKKLLG